MQTRFIINNFKDQILQEVNSWVLKATINQNQANYKNYLVQSHNSRFCTQFTQKDFQTELVEVFKELEEVLATINLKVNKSLAIEFENDTQQFAIKLVRKSQLDVNEMSEKWQKGRKQVKKEDINVQTKLGNIDEIDTSYDFVSNLKQINITDKDVTNRFSRYIGVMGIESVTKQSNAAVLIIGFDSLAAEIAKNIVLSGVKRLTIFDNKIATNQDLLGNFFLTEEDIGKRRVNAAIKKLQQLNLYVQVDNVPETIKFNYINNYCISSFHSLISTETNFNLLNYQVVIVTEPTSLQDIYYLNTYCHSKQISFILSITKGLFTQCFIDFGDKFIVNDPLGEPALEQIIKFISNDAEGTVELIDGEKCLLVEGSMIEMREIVEVEESGKMSFNGMQFKVKKVEKNRFYIGDTKGYKKYVKNGIAKQLIEPITLNFQTYQHYCNSDTIFDPYSQNLLSQQLLQEDKLEQSILMHYCFLCSQILDLQLNNTEPYKIYQLFLETFENIFLHLVLKALQVNSKEKLKFYESTILLYIISLYGKYPPIDAFMGGIVAQEAIKSITKKFTPIHQFYYYNCTDLFEFNHEESLSTLKTMFNLQSKTDFLRLICGDSFFKKCTTAKIFQIGAGALGCELLKNFAMLGLCCKNQGQLIITDPDLIENSNLSRQFLFREKHMQKPKSTTAAASILQMNQDMKGHVEARLDKLDSTTNFIYNEEFFSSMDIISNGLDNVAARRFIDEKCVQSRTKLIDSGTLGSKGHVQVIIPFLTESYSSQSDPEENQQIPQCTLKLFPEEPVHCIEWALSKFNDYFFVANQNYNKIDEIVKSGQVEGKIVNSVLKRIKLIQRIDNKFENCIKEAIIQFNKYFFANILSLLKAYPKNMVDKISGQPFWKLPRRLPQPAQFDPLQHAMHFQFVCSFANLLATMTGIEKKKINMNEIDKIRQEIGNSNFVENEKIIKKIQKSVEKEKGNIIESEVEQDETDNNINILKEIKIFLSANKNSQLNVIEFEKDNDTNFHIDLLHSMTNCRSENYELIQTSWIDVKLKAGKITPAMVTTTAVIAALQTMELMKMLHRSGNQFQNSFLNLAVPSLIQSQPSDAKKYQINSILTVNLWDRWELKLSQEIQTLQNVMNHFEQKYQLRAQDVFFGAQSIYVSSLMSSNQENKAILNEKLTKLFESELSKINLTITFTLPNSNIIINNIPMIRIYLK